MGHELRTPLNAIIGFIKLVEDGLYTSEEERRDYLASARESARTLLDLINNILDLARIESGRLKLDSVELNLAELVDEVTRTLAPEAHARGVEIEGSVDPGVPARLQGDPLRLRQVLYNLAGNAVKFTDTGLVLLRVELEHNGREASEVRFTVRDTGAGVPPELQPHIFDSFVQLHESGVGRSGGIGLGLPIARQIVEQMGGSIEFASRLHEGSTFWFTLTLPRGRTYGAGARTQDSELQGARVLLVNPDPETRELYLHKLTQAGADAEAVASSEAAWERLQAAQGGGAPIRSVLLDRHLGRDDLLVLARRIRREQGWYQPDLVHVALIGGAADAGALRDAGVHSFVTKPVTPAGLRNALGALIARHGPRGIAQAAAPGPLRGAAGVPAARRFAQILVAEDNAVNQKLIQALLTKQGYGTRIAHNGREAVEAIQHERFDLVLMDVQMPVLDGLAAARAIRQLPQGARVPIVAMTADGLEGDRERCLAAGMDDYLPKPILPDVLRRKLEHWLQQAGNGEFPEPAGPGERSTVLDLVHLEAVRAYAGQHDPPRFAAWLHLFRTEAQATLRRMSAADRSDEIRAAAEHLALVCAGFGAPRLLALARRLATVADLGDREALQPLVHQAQSAFREMEAVLAERFGAGPQQPPAA
jgi:CheY-like chemotaxis protein